MQLAAMYMDWSSFSFLSRSVAVYCKRSKQAKRRRLAEAAAAREGRPKIGSMDNISRGVARSEECGVGERERREERGEREESHQRARRKKRQHTTHEQNAKRKTLYQLFF